MFLSFSFLSSSKSCLVQQDWPQQTEERGFERGTPRPLSGWQQPKMADFDAIYEDQDENSSILEAPSISLIPDPVIVRGAGNITVWVPFFLTLNLSLYMWLRSPLSPFQVRSLKSVRHRLPQSAACQGGSRRVQGSTTTIRATPNHTVTKIPCWLLIQGTLLNHNIVLLISYCDKSHVPNWNCNSKKRTNRMYCSSGKKF